MQMQLLLWGKEWGAGAQRAGRKEGRNEERKRTKAQVTKVMGRTVASILRGEESHRRFLAEERGDLLRPLLPAWHLESAPTAV